MSHETFPSAEPEHQENHLEQSEPIKSTKPSWLKRKIVAGGLAAASLIGVTGISEHAQGQQVKKESPRIELSEKYRAYYHMGVIPEALLIAADMNIQQDHLQEVTSNLPKLISQLEKMQRMADGLLKTPAGEDAPAPKEDVREEGEKYENGLMGASESELSQMILDQVIRKVQENDLRSLEAWLPRLIAELRKRVEMATMMEKAEQQSETH